MQSIRKILRQRTSYPIPIRLLERALSLILQDNSFQFCQYLQTHGTAMGTKMAVAFANIFMAKVGTEILKVYLKPLIWKRYVDDIFSLDLDSKQRGDTVVH